MTSHPRLPKELPISEGPPPDLRDGTAVLPRSPIRSKMEDTRRMNRADLFGAAISGICAVHCTLTPLFFAARPLLHTGHHAGHWWATLDYIFLVLSLLAVAYSARRTASRTVRISLWAGWALFAGGLLLEPLELSFAKGLMYAGSVTLIVAHLWNHRHCKVR